MRLTCHGHSLTSVSWPPTILVALWARPQVQSDDPVGWTLNHQQTGNHSEGGREEKEKKKGGRAFVVSAESSLLKAECGLGGLGGPCDQLSKTEDEAGFSLKKVPGLNMNTCESSRLTICWTFTLKPKVYTTTCNPYTFLTNCNAVAQAKVYHCEVQEIQFKP